jgi:hypothetical protein
VGRGAGSRERWWRSQEAERRKKKARRASGEKGESSISISVVQKALRLHEGFKKHDRRLYSDVWRGGGVEWQGERRRESASPAGETEITFQGPEARVGVSVFKKEQEELDGESAVRRMRWEERSRQEGEDV